MARTVGKAARMVAGARAMARQSQSDLAARLAEISGQEWNRNHVASIENGARALKADDLWIFSRAQGVPITWYVETELPEAADMFGAAGP